MSHQENMRRQLTSKDMQLRRAERFQDSQEYGSTPQTLPRKNTVGIEKIRATKVPEKKDSIDRWRSLGTEKGLYNEQEIADMLDRNANLLEKYGLKEIEISTHSAIKSYDKTIYAIEIKGISTHSGLLEKGWVTLEPADADRKKTHVAYVINFEHVQTALEVVELPPSFSLEWLQEVSEERKVVKSRPMFMYPELFNLPPDEVWPYDQTIAVIGDPYQACDREQTTLIDYEYADEMLPPILHTLLVKRNDESSKMWLENLYHEDLNALDRVYGNYDPSSANPYKAFTSLCSDFFNNIAKKISKDATAPLEKTDELRYQELRNLAQSLMNGTWTLDQGTHIVEENGRREQTSYALSNTEKNDLKEWFIYKQTSIEGMGNPERWSTYVQRWENYLEQLPHDYLKQHLPGIEQKIEQARTWINILPTATSPERINNGLQALAKFYGELMVYYQDEGEAAKIFDHEIETIEETGLMSDLVLGYFRPGYPLSRRNRATIKEFVDRIDQILVYQKKILPNLMAEKRRLEQLEVPLTTDSLHAYLRSFERAQAQEIFFKKRTQKAVPVHGFFPHNMPDMPPQDRILALTSVTMHGWNQLDQTGFEHDIQAALPFLRKNGKYILGPINQHTYFSGIENNEFDAQGLTKALTHLKQKGLIDYYFIKGVRSKFVDQAYSQTEDDEPLSFDPDHTVLNPGESAHSLVITKQI